GSPSRPCSPGSTPSCASAWARTRPRAWFRWWASSASSSRSARSSPRSFHGRRGEGGMTPLEALSATYPYRVLAGAIFFLTLGVIDRVRHPEDPRRAKEYLFLLFAMTAAILYGIAHDHVTAT